MLIPLALAQRSSFAPAFWLLPEPRRAALGALHGFCRAIDEAVDGGDSETARRELARWSGEVDALYEGTLPRTGEGRALQGFVARYGLAREDFRRFLRGLERDVEGGGLETEADLIDYCEGVASSPGYLALGIFGCPGAREYARRLGIALQLTNVLRDARQDLSRGRSYFPRQDVARFGTSDDALASEARAMDAPAADATRRLVEFERARAVDWYDAVDLAYAAEPAAARARLAPARGMERLYHALFERLAREDPLPRTRPRLSVRSVVRALAVSWNEARSAARMAEGRL